MLLTAQRESEVAGMRWSEIDLENRSGPSRQPAKNGKLHIVHLCRARARSPRTVPRIVGQDLVFSGTARAGFRLHAKARLDGWWSAV